MYKLEVEVTHLSEEFLEFLSSNDVSISYINKSINGHFDITLHGNYLNLQASITSSFLSCGNIETDLEILVLDAELQ